MDWETAVTIVLIVVASVVLAIVAAAETALERASRVRIQALAARGDERARRIVGSVEQPVHFLGPLTAARALSSAVVVAAAAYIGAREFDPFEGAAGVGMAGGLSAAVLQMTVGLIAARQPEYTAIRLSRVVRVTGFVFALPAFVLGLPARFIAGSLSLVTPEHDAEDLLSLVEREEASGGVEEQGRRMIRGVIALEDKSAREIMVPRIDVAAAPVDETLDELVRLVNERGFSRIPVYRETIDDVAGIVYAKDLLRAVSTGQKRTLGELLREAYFIPETKRLDELLTEMRARRTHMAIVVDEYGGVAGIVTIEDLLEEIVGEIEDEYDVAAPQVERISADEVLLDAGSPTAILDELFDFRVESEDFDTVGGFLIQELGRLPAVGDEIAVDGLTLRVLSMAGRRVKRVRVARVAAREDAAARA